MRLVVERVVEEVESLVVVGEEEEEGYKEVEENIRCEDMFCSLDVGSSYSIKWGRRGHFLPRKQFQ